MNGCWSCEWQGASGAWFMHTIHPFTRELALKNVNYGFVRRNADDSRTPLYWGIAKDSGERFARHEKFFSAWLFGANEIHIHFGGGERSRLQIETDLRHGHWTPLNDQPTPAAPADPLAALLSPGVNAQAKPPITSTPFNGLRAYKTLQELTAPQAGLARFDPSRSILGKLVGLPDA
jgi:hypothetical protein